MKTITVQAAEGVLVPIEGAPRKSIGTSPVSVPDTAYYRRRLADGDLILVVMPTSAPDMPPDTTPATTPETSPETAPETTPVTGKKKGKEASGTAAKGVSDGE